MIQAIEIKNFKSIEELKIEFGRVNVLIGENGCGKSAILEALTFAAAAESDRLDAEFLENRGIRVTSPQFMRSSFDKVNENKPIELTLEMGARESNKHYSVSHSNETFAEWKVDKNSDDFNDDEIEVLKQVFQLKDSEGQYDKGQITKVLRQLNDTTLFSIEGKMQFRVLKSFVIYAPQNKQLRSLTEEGSIRPVGIYGEGLFKLIREIHKTQPEAIEDIDKGLSLMGWYRAMDLDNTPAHPDDELYIQDKFLTEPFTQRSANEGFLYVLFYMAVMVSKDTPTIFAIDNIDAALNPKLCAKITSYLVELAKKYDKQIFLTTQNPATLDGLDLADDEQKLLIVSRKRRGQTTVKRFTQDKMPKNEHGEGIRLSEAMIRGYIGGIPKGF